MITFSKLGRYGRLGNQLFQYAYLRGMARRLNTSFWCPRWEGDVMFDLDDGGERSCGAPERLGRLYDQGTQAGFSPEALDIEDGVDIQGYFQSERYYDSPTTVRGWYRFKPDLIRSATQKVNVGLLNGAVSMSLRLDTDYASTREFFPLYRPSFYMRGLALVKNVRQVVVFADRMDLARDYVDSMKMNLPVTFMEGLTPHEQMWLMTQCSGGNIITNSTFAWWGAYLNAHDDAVVVAPREWVRPGVPVPIRDVLPGYWVKLDALRPVVDHFQMWRITHPMQTVRRVLRKFQ